MPEIDAIRQTLAAAAGRRRWQRALNGLCRGLFYGSAIWLLALGVYKLAPVPYAVAQGAAGVALLLTIIFFALGWRHKPSLAQTARWVDAREHLQERLSTALELSQTSGDESWRTLLLADAARFAQGIDPRKLAPLRLPQISRWAVLMLALCAALGFVPEYRSKAFVENQQDAAIIKDAAKQVVTLTKHSLEQRPPALEQTRQALEAAEEAGVKLDQHPVTRTEALKDLANVADKLKQQIKDLGDKNPGLKAVEKAAREASSGGAENQAWQKQMEALQKSLGKAAENQAKLDKLAEALQKAQRGMEAMPKGDSA